jgi:GNAT superfamily N-acetyltransferase
MRIGSLLPGRVVQDLGWPPGWAGGRGLAVQPGARGHGVARSLIAECERLARPVGAPTFAFHSAPFMTAAVALYDGLGYRRAPQNDVVLGRLYDVSGSAEIRIIAYFKDLT